MSLNDLVGFFVPRRCANCGDSGLGAILCRRCHDKLPWLDPDQCSQPLPLGLGRTVAALALRDDARTWVHRFKYPGRGLVGLDPAAIGVARLLARAAGRRAPVRAADRIVPIPLHPRRFRQRGFNPAALLAREIARLHGSSVETDWLARVLDTPRQAGLDAPSRRRNVVGAFAVAPRREPVASRVWLVDDVTTTGATLGSAAEALRRAGVREVMGICLARTPDAQSV